MHGAGRHEHEVALRDGHVKTIGVTDRVVGGGLAQGIEVIRGTAGYERGARFGVEDVPGLGLLVVVLHARGVLLVGVHLNGEVVGGVHVAHLHGGIVGKRPDDLVVVLADELVELHAGVLGVEHGADHAPVRRDVERLSVVDVPAIGQPANLRDPGPSPDGGDVVGFEKNRSH